MSKSLDFFIKQPSEAFFIGGSIEYVKNGTEAIDVEESSVVVTDADGEDVTDTLIEEDSLTVDEDDNILMARVQGGAAASSPYKVTFLVATDEGNIFEIDVKMKVEEA